MLNWILAFLLSAGAAWAAVPAQLAPDPQQAKIARILANSLPLNHLSRERFDDEIASSALDLYINALDYEHSFFLASDIASFRGEAGRLDDQVKNGELSTPFHIYEVFKDRVSNRVAFVEQLVAKGFDLESEETMAWKRKKAPWPANEAEWDELWRKKTQNEYVARLVAKKLGEEDQAAGSSTNAVEEAEMDHPDVNGETAPAPADAHLPPQQAILKSYQRYLTLLNDNDATWVVDRYFNAFTQSYDPHSDYLSPNSAEDFDISMRLSLVGIGALLSSDEGAARVERLIPGGPAEKDGRLKPGDKIIAVAQDKEPAVDILHWPLNKTVRLIRGEKGTRVVLTVIPASDISGSTTRRIDLIRDEVKLEEQAAKSSVREIKGPDGISRTFGVIKLPEFYADMKSGADGARSSARDVKKILDELVAKNVDGIVLDLRNNGGGSLAEAINMTGEFIESGPVVQVKDQKRLQILSDPDPEVTYTGPLIVLVNRMSASASEILAAALQDYGRALIVGDTKTHGKGTVQTLTNLSQANPGLGQLKLTTASFYRIAGGSTQLNGVKPDIVLPSALDSMELGEEYLPHALAWTEVYQAFYEPVNNFSNILPKLLENSEKRRSEDAKFSAYMKLVGQLSERQQKNEISLNFEDRLQLARAERELEKQLRPPEQKKQEKKQDGAKEDEPDDPVLSETLSILADLVVLQARQQAESQLATKPQS
jgi:carboxyl-terminal processing protease